MTTTSPKAKPEGSKETVLAAEGGEFLDPMRVIAVIPIRPYHVVADIFCGSGSFTVPFAKYLFDGKVYAMDSQAEHLESLRKRLQELRLTNVELIHAEECSIPLKAEALDGAILPFTLHAVKERVRFLQVVHGLLKRGGWVAVLEWYKRETPDGPPLEERVGEEEAEKAAREAGFRFSEKRDINGKHYLVILRK
ncbi:MAG: class I SAM-dependent methyltransferase [Chloroflexi bacterium]|nr:class I SAM-dependent methyltransferase [Chloroflexota bacterium]